MVRDTAALVPRIADLMTAIHHATVDPCTSAVRTVIAPQGRASLIAAMPETSVTVADRVTIALQPIAARVPA